MAWDGSDNGGSTSRGVTSHDDPNCPDCVKVVLLGSYPATDAELNSDAPVGPSEENPLNPTTFKVLRQFFQNHFQTYGRRVQFFGYPCFGPCSKKDADAVNALQPFAAIPAGSLNGNAAFDGYLADDGIEVFRFAQPEGYVGPANFEDGLLHQASPYLWSFQPSIGADMRDGAAWVCQSLVGKPPTETVDPALSRAPGRKIALGYRTLPTIAAAVGTDVADASAANRTNDLALSKQIADRFAAAVDATCGNGGHVFDQFGSDQDLWVEDDYSTGLGTIEGPNDPTVAEKAVALLKQHGDTSVLCLLCGPPSSAGQTNQDADQFAQAEIQTQYFPERIFVGGTDEDPWGARQHHQGTYNGAFGLSELWQIGGYPQTYWFRAYAATSSQSAISMVNGFGTYERFMQLFAAIQLAGPTLNPHTVQWGTTGRGGLYSWRRGFSATTGPLDSKSSPAAAYTPDKHWFLSGMTEERWDTGGVPPGGPYQSVFGTLNGCFRIIDPATRYSADGWPGTSRWPSGPDSDHSNQSVLSAPCTGDYASDL